MGASPSNGTPLFRFSGRFIPISRPTPINAGREGGCGGRNVSKGLANVVAFATHNI